MKLVSLFCSLRADTIKDSCFVNPFWKLERLLRDKTVKSGLPLKLMVPGNTSGFVALMKEALQVTVNHCFLHQHHRLCQDHERSLLQCLKSHSLALESLPCQELLLRNGSRILQGGSLMLQRTSLNALGSSNSICCYITWCESGFSEHLSIGLLKLLACCKNTQPFCLLFQLFIQEKQQHPSNSG